MSPNFFGDILIIKPEVTEEEFWQLSNEDSNYELIDDNNEIGRSC